MKSRSHQSSETQPSKNKRWRRPPPSTPTTSSTFNADDLQEDHAGNESKFSNAGEHPRQSMVFFFIVIIQIHPLSAEHDVGVFDTSESLVRDTCVYHMVPIKGVGLITEVNAISPYPVVRHTQIEGRLPVRFAMVNGKKGVICQSANLRIRASGKDSVWRLNEEDNEFRDHVTADGNIQSLTHKKLFQIRNISSGEGYQIFLNSDPSPLGLLHIAGVDRLSKIKEGFPSLIVKFEYAGKL